MCFNEAQLGSFFHIFGYNGKSFPSIVIHSTVSIDYCMCEKQI